jgi:hypothetical protein
MRVHNGRTRERIIEQVFERKKMRRVEGGSLGCVRVDSRQKRFGDMRKKRRKIYSNGVPKFSGRIL